jgi:hypothetical protein
VRFEVAGDEFACHHFCSLKFSQFLAKGWFSMSQQKGWRGAPWIKFLIEISIVATLAGILVAAVQTIRETAARADSLNNLKQIGIAANSHNDATGFLPCSGTTTYNVDSMEYTGPKAYANLGSYAYQLFPYMEVAWDLPRIVLTNREIASSTRAKFCLCKGRDRPAGVGLSVDYAWNMAINTSRTSDAVAPQVILPPTGGAKSDTYILRNAREIPDGAAYTILAGHKYLPTSGTDFPSYVCKDTNYFMVGGTVDTAIGSYEYRPDSTDAGQNLWGGPFAKGGLFVFVDGSARQIPYSQASTSGTSNFAYMIRPDDGQKVHLP